MIASDQSFIRGRRDDVLMRFMHLIPLSLLLILTGEKEDDELGSFLEFWLWVISKCCHCLGVSPIFNARSSV